ncbi:hypothetical protein CEXT_35881 [Caerostris extrusa]|uniref:Uncharacterized protein n=1 Tax=Caerostris extrusa TaxID=172846 RepID=A0AAV4P8Z5_CAEEX|nr:hypothetical protein CEXT_35881 [Caerostris extrusa]
MVPQRSTILLDRDLRLKVDSGKGKFPERSNLKFFLSTRGHQESEDDYSKLRCHEVYAVQQLTMVHLRQHLWLPLSPEQTLCRGFPEGRRTSADVCCGPSLVAASPDYSNQRPFEMTRNLSFFRRRQCSERHFCFPPPKKKKKGTRQEVKENKVDTSLNNEEK